MTETEIPDEIDVTKKTASISVAYDITVPMEAVERLNIYAENIARTTFEEQYGESTAFETVVSNEKHRTNDEVTFEVVIIA